MMKTGIVLMIIPAAIAVLWAIKEVIKEAIEGDKNDLIVIVVCTLIAMFGLGLILCMSGSMG